MASWFILTLDTTGDQEPVPEEAIVADSEDRAQTLALSRDNVLVGAGSVDRVSTSVTILDEPGK
jgi:hypothetical protein